MCRPGRGEALTAPWAGHGASRRQTRTRTRTAATRQPARPLPGAQSPLRHRHRRGLRGGHAPGTAFWSARGPRALPAHTAGARARGEGGPQGLPRARGDVAESGAEELLDSGEACNPVRLSGSFNVRFHTAPEGAILDEASRMFFEHPSRDAFGSKDTAHSPRGCRCAACSNWRERVPSSTAGRTSSLNGTAEVSRARTLLSGRNPRRSPKQWPGEHTSGPGDGAWLTCVRVRAGARFLGCCGPRLACGCDGKCARPAGAADACPLEASAALAPTSRATRHGSAWNVGTSGGRPPSPPAQVCAPQSVQGKRRPQGSCSGPHGRVLCILLSAWGTRGSVPPPPTTAPITYPDGAFAETPRKVRLLQGSEALGAGEGASLRRDQGAAGRAPGPAGR